MSAHGCTNLLNTIGAQVEVATSDARRGTERDVVVRECVRHDGHFAICRRESPVLILGMMLCAKLLDVDASGLACH